MFCQCLTNELAQQLGAPAVLPEDPDQFPIIHTANTQGLQFPLLASAGTRHTCGTQTYKQNTHTQKD